MVTTPHSRTEHRTPPQVGTPDSIARFASDVVRGRIRDVKTLLQARSGPVTRDEIEELSQELRRLEQPKLSDVNDPQNLDITLSKISTFGQRRKVLADYRQCLHDILQLQHRAQTLARSEEQLRILRRRVPGAGISSAADLKARISFWETTVVRDRESVVAIEDRLKADFPLSLVELRKMIALQDS